MPFKLRFNALPNNGNAFGTVYSVNGKTGVVVLNANDVGADVAGSAAATKVELQNEFNPQFESLNSQLTSFENQVESQINDLNDNKLDRSEYKQLFLGVFPSKAALDAAHPTAEPGSSADIDSGAGFDVMRAIWDESDQKWVIHEVNNAQNTDQVPEGQTNLYFKPERVLDTILNGFTTAVSTTVVSTDKIVVGFGKLQAQITNFVSNLSVNVRNTVLTGIVFTNKNKVVAVDSIETAVGKLQGQVDDLSPPSWVNLSTVATVPAYIINSTLQVARINGLLWIRGSFSLSSVVEQYYPLATFTNAQYKSYSYHSSNQGKLLNIINIYRSATSAQQRQLTYESNGNVTNASQAASVQQYLYFGAGSLNATDGVITIAPVTLGELAIK